MMSVLPAEVAVDRQCILPIKLIQQIQNRDNFAANQHIQRSAHCLDMYLVFANTKVLSQILHCLVFSVCSSMKMRKNTGNENQVLVRLRAQVCHHDISLLQLLCYSFVINNATKLRNSDRITG